MHEANSASARRRSTVRPWLAGIALALACLMPAGEASAASKVCRKLEAQLVSLSSSGRTTGQSRKYDGAIARQRQQLSIARGRASDLGCGFSVFGRNSRQCAGLNATISRMQDNLATLERTRGSMAGGGGKSRSRILASLEANGCRGGADVAQRRPQEDVGTRNDNRPGLIASLFGLKSRGVEESRQDRREVASLDPELRVPKEEGNVRRVKRDKGKPDEAIATAAPRGTFATMCVRTCDGYFFPMSPASSAQDFDRDQKNCESACPGAEMQVFYRGAGDSEDSDMTSVATGRPYTELATAYRYKDGSGARPATCGCNVAKNFSVVAGNPPAPAPAVSESAAAPTTAAAPAETTVVAVPEQTGDQAAPVAAATAASPEPSKTGAIAPDASSPSIITIIPAAPSAPTAGQDVATSEPAAQPASPEPAAAQEPAERDLDASDRKVRVVGPVFLPDPAEAIDLRAPARTQVQ